MPELPEVETIVRVLEKSLLNQKVNSIELRYEKLLEENSPYPLSVLLNRSFTGFDRRGKYLIFEFDHLYYWIVHLRMEGKFHLYDKETAPSKHTHLLIETQDHHVHYLDTRKFSRMAVTQDPDAYFASKKLGPEPFGLDLNDFYKNIKKSRRSIKNIILDQSVIVGIGNIYADEILFASSLHPLRKGTSIKKKEAALIAHHTELVLKAAIKQGGTTIRSYTSSLNVHGRFQVALNAYGQKGLACNRCSTIMEGMVIGGRSSVYCPQCQKVKS